MKEGLFSQIKQELILNSQAFDIVVNDLSTYNILKDCREYLNSQYDLIKQISKEIDYFDEKMMSWGWGCIGRENLPLLIEKFDEFMDYENLKENMIWRAPPKIIYFREKIYKLSFRIGYEAH